MVVCGVKIALQPEASLLCGYSFLDMAQGPVLLSSCRARHLLPCLLPSCSRPSGCSPGRLHRRCCHRLGKPRQRYACPDVSLESH